MTKSNQDSILITGATGFIGQFLVKKLAETGNSKLILNCRNREKQKRFKSHECTNVDLSDKESIHLFFEEYQPGHIIHLAALARIAHGEKNPDKAYKTNYIGTKLLIDLAIKNRVKTFVFVSSDLVRNHKSVVGITKYLSEAYIQNLEKNTTKLITVRIPNVSWTPGSVHLIFERLINENQAITITHPDMSRRFVTGNEAADFICYGLEKGNDKDIFFVSKQPDKITDIAREMIDESGKDLNIEYIGMRPGEKLAEEAYEPDEIKHTGFEEIALLKQKSLGVKKTAEAITMLQNKPGFTIVVEKVIHD